MPHREFHASPGLGRRLIAPLTAIVLVFAYGVAGYMMFGFDFVDALYMTALALTTAGFNPAGELTQAAKSFTVSIAILGVTFFLIVLAIITSAITEGRIGVRSRRSRMERRIEKLSGHYIICAYGRVGRTVAREFEAEGVDYVVIDGKEELEEQMRTDGVMYLIGDPTSEVVLKRAGVEQARGLVTAVDSDTANVYITLTSRSLNPSIFITARASEPESPDLLYRAGADRVISPYVTSGRHMAITTLRPRVVDYLDVIGEESRMRLEELLIEKDSALIGKSLREACGAAVPLLLRKDSGEALPNPSIDERLSAGDVILLFGRPGDLRPVEGG